MLRLLESLPTNYKPRIYVKADTDKLSEQKILKLENSRISSKAEEKDFEILTIKRSREVHQSWISTIFSTLIALKHSLFMVYETKPDVLLCNGPGTCVPLCLVVFLFKIIFINFPTKIIFIESICRAKSISLAGHILYHIVDGFVVQWPELTQHYPRTAYLGKIF